MATASNQQNNDEVDFNTSPLLDEQASQQSRRTYMLTYSRADMARFPDCESFTKCALEAFDSGKSAARVVQWAACLESHADGEQKHYHMAIKLSGTRRWQGVSKYLREHHNIVVNFSSDHCDYVAAYRYICKDKPKEQVLHSPDHNNLEVLGSSPRTKNAMQKFSANSKRRRSSAATATAACSDNTPMKKTKPKRLTNTDVSEFLVQENIQTERELMLIAKKRHDDGEKDLYNFILNKTPKALNDLVYTTWKIQNTPALVERTSKSRILILIECGDKPCVENCNGQWFACANEVLKNNRVNIYTFADAMRKCLTNGRQKHNNIMIVGPTNCGKLFLLDPLEMIYKTFMNPSATSYAWVGLEACEVAYLNDFRYSQECIKWSDFLLLLEGQTVNLPRPKNQFSSDLTISRSNTISFFATSKNPIEYIGKYNIRDDRETDMMSSRWNVFTFHHQIPTENIKVLPRCPHCFAHLVMRGSNMD